MLYSFRLRGQDVTNMAYPQHFDTEERELSEPERKGLVDLCRQQLKAHPTPTGVAPSVWAHWYCIVNSSDYVTPSA